MATLAVEQVKAALGEFLSASRLYEFHLKGDEVTLLVEAFSASDGLQSIGQRDVILLSTHAAIGLSKLLGQQGTLDAILADGSRSRFTGLISEAAMLGSVGGLTRYRLRLRPWLWRLSQVRNSRVWQDKTVIEIVESVFQGHAPLAQWRWSDETASFMADAGTRSYCCQYRESDLDFVTRLLTEEGLSWRFEEVEDGHSMVLFANSIETSATPPDPSSEAGGGIRFHGARVGEATDAIQALRAHRSLRVSLSTVLSYDYKAKRAVAASVPTNGVVGGPRAPMLESYDTPGQYFFADGEQAQRYALLQMQAQEARRHLWSGRSTVRTLRAGTRFTLTQGPLATSGEDPQYVVLRVVSVGVNNLPTPVRQGLAELFGQIPELLDETIPEQPDNFAAVIVQASDSGYANYFEAVLAKTPWRPVTDENGLRHHPKPTAHGSQTAIVVGADGGTSAAGADEIYCDKLGRVRIVFHWQQDTSATCWVRVAQRSAGGGMGSQFLPRIGQEVLVQFLENDIDRPIILGALYNGQGEGGQLPTPGGKSDRDSDIAVFQSAHDHTISGQGNLAGGNSPLWHGAAADNAGHRNSAAQWGIRSKEFGGNGYNQLLFDDTDNQGRIHLKSSHAASELTLGHLIHAADNYRGSLRGTGVELRTDGYGAVRAGAGLLVSSYKISHSLDTREPAGDNSAGMALLKQASTLGATFSCAAKTHETVAFASHLGAAKADNSRLDDKSAPLKALLTAASGMSSQDSVDAARTDAPGKPFAPGDDKLPHTSGAIIAIAAKAGLGVLSGANLQLANGETMTLMSGQDTQFATGCQLRVHSGQAIGLLAGAVKAGEGNVGVQMIAAKGAIDIQAQADVMNLQARDEVNIISANAHIDWAAAKSISLSTAGGANITIAGGNITIQCPGKITIHAGKKSFEGAARSSYKIPVFPAAVVGPAVGRKLESSFASDQLTLVAKNFTKAEFVMLIAPIFGYDVPAATYVKLYDALRAGSIAQPKIEVKTGTHYPASFDNKSRKIWVHQAAADRAVKGIDESWELLMALMHEFGHYIDQVIRTDLADKNPDGSSKLRTDAPGDEGAKFAYGIAFFEFGETSFTTYAQYSSPDFNGALKVNYGIVRRAIRQAQDEDAQKNEGKSGHIEHFGAGMGEHHKERSKESYGHQSIEMALIKSSDRFASFIIRKQIYFGNWLRDFSQILDPAIVRKPDAPKDFPRSISRKKLTQLVDLFAELEFVQQPSEKKLFQVTESLLGVYRPVEHIDNPTNNSSNAPDPQSIDKDFQSKSTKDYVAVDPATSMKHYIGSSVKFMRDEINMAVMAGPGHDGYRHFGAALHVLEDYFAHSNFLELSLRKLGHSKVLPWTSEAAGKHKIPVVTGMFDSDDVIASTAGLIADTLFKVEWDFTATKPGERTKVDRILLISLSEHSDPRLLKSYQDFLIVRDRIAGIPGHQYLQGAMHYTLGMVGNVYNFVYSSLIHLLGNSVDDQQILRIGNPNTNGSTDPTHSQLAKDHDNHPFHTLAADLAKVAVTEVGRAMGERWWEGNSVADPAGVAASFIVHPLDSSWQDTLVRNWAEKHPEHVRRGESATEWEALEKAHRQEAIDAINKSRKKSNDVWKYVNENYETIFGNDNQVRKK